MIKFNNEITEYHKILCKEYPLWLDKYINTSEMKRLDGISVSCGTDYCGIYNPPYMYSNLAHSIGVALIIWNFTKDKKATLAGLFHDIATPVFKHCIDFMNNDHENQESTEDRTYEIIKESKEICSLLKKDNILLQEVSNYKLYPIADNDTPKLSSDRLEYTFSSGLVFKKVWDLETIKKIYNNISISNNEDNILELSFNDVNICEEYINIISNLWPSWVDDNDRTVMQFLADITKHMIDNNYITINDLYTLSENQIINKIKYESNNEIKKAFINFENIKEAKRTNNMIKNKYCVKTSSKIRYINPLVVNKGRIYNLSNESKVLIDNYLSMAKSGITYFDFECQFSKVNKTR